MYRTLVNIFMLLLIQVPRLQFDGGGVGLETIFSAARYIRQSSESDGWVGDEEIQYLTRFGYLAQLGNAQVSGDQLSQALRNLQRFAGMTETGQLDSQTRNLLTKPRCGVHDVSTGFRNKRHTSLQGEKWHRTNLSWSLMDTFKLPYQRSYLLRELHHALTVWEVDSTLKFSFLGDSEDADIRISFHRGAHDDGYPFDGVGIVLAHAFFPGGGRGGDAHFDADERWSMTSGQVREDETSLYAVALHEFGHSLGLSHSNVQESIMFPWYGHTEPIYQLPRPDRQAIQVLYGQKHDSNSREEYEYKPTSVTRTSYTSTARNRITTEPITESAPTTTELPPGGKCGTNLDAVAVIRNEMWIFKGKYFWRRKGDSQLKSPEPVEIASFWYGLPRDIPRVDAVYEMDNHQILFFVGPRYYIMFGNSHLIAGPLPLTNLGLPSSLDHIDGAMIWGYNRKTYLFSGSEYWAYDDNTRRVELDYPRNISWWAGVPHNIDAVFQYTDKKTYFFKGSKFWEFDDARKQVVTSTGQSIAEYWFLCPPSHLEVSTNYGNYAQSDFLVFSVATLFLIILI